MKNSEVASQRDELLPRIVLGTGVLESRAMLHGQAGRDEVFPVLVERERLHGLVGKESNRVMKKERFFSCIRATQSNFHRKDTRRDWSASRHSVSSRRSPGDFAKGQE